MYYPLYLTQIQQFNAMEIGQVLMWMGFPRYCFPISTKAHPNHKAQVLGYIWLLLCWLKLFRQYTYDYRLWRAATYSLKLLRAVGSPFIMVPLSLVAMKNIDNHNTADASTLTNVMRNLGGAFSIAIIATLLDNKTREHLSHIKESLPYVSITAWDTLRGSNHTSCNQEVTL